MSFNHNLDLEKTSKYYTFIDKCIEQRKNLKWKLQNDLFKI